MSIAEVPVLPDPAQARAWAREELAGPGYERPGLVRRVIGWVVDRLEQIPLPHGTGTALTEVVALLVVVVLVVWALRRAGGPLARRGAGAGEVFDATALTAAAHRAAAERAAASGDLRTAVLEHFRAVVRELEERGVMPEQPGRTAGEAAAAAGARLPALGPALAEGARSFGDVRYGGHEPTASGYEALVALDAQVRAARPTAPVPS